MEVELTQDLAPELERVPAVLAGHERLLAFLDALQEMPELELQGLFGMELGPDDLDVAEAFHEGAFLLVDLQVLLGVVHGDVGVRLEDPDLPVLLERDARGGE